MLSSRCPPSRRAPAARGRARRRGTARRPAPATELQRHLGAPGLDAHQPGRTRRVGRQPQRGHPARAQRGADRGPNSRRAAAIRASENDARQIRSATVEPADRADQRRQDPGRLDVEVEPDVRPGAQQVLQPHDRLPAADARPGQLRPGQRLDPPGAVGHPLQRRVVEGDEDAVGGHPDVGLQVAVAQRHAGLEGRHGVLQVLDRAAAVGHRQRGGPVEEGEARAGHGDHASAWSDRVSGGSGRRFAGSGRVPGTCRRRRLPCADVATAAGIGGHGDRDASRRGGPATGGARRSALRLVPPRPAASRGPSGARGCTAARRAGSAPTSSGRRRRRPGCPPTSSS